MNLCNDSKHLRTREVEQIELAAEIVDILLVGQADEVKAFHDRKGDPQVRPNVARVGVQIERLQIAARTLVIVAEIGVRNAKVEPTAGVPEEKGTKQKSTNQITPLSKARRNANRTQNAKTFK